MNRAFVTYLGSDNFLPGVLALYQSLKDVHSKEKLAVLVTSDISSEVQTILSNLDIRVKRIDHIINSENLPKSTNFKLKNSYTKLNIFQLVEYQKIVYIDADMLICNNVDELFNMPHFSAVNAGGMLHEYADWVDLNAGLLVIKPSIVVFNDLLSQIGKLSSRNCGDQGFLQSYLPEWPNKPELHLDHKYNIFVGHLDRYHAQFNYDFPNSCFSDNIVSVVHFWGDRKPWIYSISGDEEKYYQQAFKMWYKCYDRVLDTLRKTNYMQCESKIRRQKEHMY